LTPEQLRWRCPESWLDFETTADIEPLRGVVGQDDAMESLRFGLELKAHGQNIFVRGLTGTGRMTLVRQLLQELAPTCSPADDRCFVHHFAQPDRPRLISLPAGQGRAFRRRIDRLIDFIAHELIPRLSSDGMRARRSRLDQEIQQRLRELGQPFEDRLREAGLALVPVQIGPTVQPTILPLLDGEPAPVERLQQLRAEGKLDPAEAQRILERIGEFERQLQEIGEKISQIQDEHRAATRALHEEAARALLARETAEIERGFPGDAVRAFLDELVTDLVRRRLKDLKDDQQFLRLYRVNLVARHEPGDPCSIVVESTPTVQHLLGDVEREFLVGGMIRSDHLMIRAGSLLRADGGFLILEARDLLSEPGAWKAIVRTLRSGRLEIVPAETAALWPGPLLKPEPVAVDVKVILLGDPELYYMLDAYDPDFPHLFKVLADFSSDIERDEVGARFYAGVLARIAGEERLAPFSRQAVAALVEHGARIAARGRRLTTRFGRLVDVAREAAFLARKEGRLLVSGTDVGQAVQRSKQRADLPSRRFRRLVAEGGLRIRASGAEVGQVNGLAVIHAGPLTYGFPTRITATIGAGTAGAINIEREAELSGAIHTKGFYILGGLLRHLLRTEHPLAFSASVAFEQSYAGIDGDSASGAEICCLLSALTGVPLRQDLAMTGAIDQLGHVLPVGAVTEKVEGFFDVCRDLGLTGTQGVIVPRDNAADLMLRHDVVEACAQDRFCVHAVETIHEALELLTGVPAGQPDADGHYPEGTVLGLAEAMALKYWRMASATGEGGG